MIISAFPGTGKSFYYEEHKYDSNRKVLDSDSSKFNKKHFPANYIRQIKKNIKFEVIFVSSHKEVRDALVKNNMWFILVYPDKSLKDEYINRFKERGSPESFIKLISNNWDNWIDEMKNQTNCLHIVLKDGEYISNNFCLHCLIKSGKDYCRKIEMDYYYGE